MQTEQDTQFSEQCNHLVEMLRGLLADPTDTWQVTTHVDGYTEVSRRVTANPGNRQDGVTVEIKFAPEHMCGSLQVAVDGTLITLSFGAIDSISVMVKSFCKRHQDDKITAESAKEAKAIEALAQACAVMRVSASCKVTATGTIETQE